MIADELEIGLKENEKGLNRLLDEKYLRIEQQQLLTRLEEEQALNIAKIEKDIQELQPDNQVGETIRGIITAMKDEMKIRGRNYVKEGLKWRVKES